MTEFNSGAGPSPFERSMPTRSRRVLRIALSLAMVAAAVLVAVVLTRATPEATATVGHNHAAATSDSALPVALTPEGARRIGVTFAAVTIGAMSTDVTSLGEVTYDETRTTAIAPRVDGWVEKLHVNFTGQEVREGEALLDIYSPMLVTAQEELLLAARLVRDVANGTEEAKRGAEEMLASARRRLQYWNIPAADIERIERTGQATRAVTLRSTSRGVVVEKRVLSGQRIMAGETLYRLADLRTIWVDAQVFEHDLALVRTGQRVSVEVQAYPGERWPGSVTYVYPIVDATTRTARIRVTLANPGQRLKPGMFATVRLTSASRERVLSVPRSAVLATGKRSIVFLKTASGTLEPVEVVTGATNDDRIEIRNGLQPGDTVVASATFLIDAESNLKAALDNMAEVPGLDAPLATPVQPSSPKGAPKRVPPVEDHSMHGMADTIRTPQRSIPREE